LGFGDISGNLNKLAEKAGIKLPTNTASSVPLEINELMKNEAAKVIIDIKDGTPIVGYMQEDLSIAGSAEFNTPAESQQLQKATDFVNKFSLLSGGAVGKNIKIMSVGNVKQTLLSWTSSAKPLFTVPLTFVALTRQDDPREIVKRLYKCVFPTFSSGSMKSFGVNLNLKGINGAKVATAPLGYKGVKGGKGTITVQIGSWFRAPNLVMTSVDFNFSKVMVGMTTEAGKQIGFPLYAVGSIAFTPMEDIDYNQLASYIGVKP